MKLSLVNFKNTQENLLENQVVIKLNYTDFKELKFQFECNLIHKRIYELKQHKSFDTNGLESIEKALERLFNNELIENKFKKLPAENLLEFVIYKDKFNSKSDFYLTLNELKSVRLVFINLVDIPLFSSEEIGEDKLDFNIKMW